MSAIPGSTAELAEPAADPTRRSRQALETLAFRAGALPLAFLTTIITSRFLLPTGRGTYVLGVLSVTLLVCVLGSGTAITHHVGRQKDVLQAVVIRGLLLSVGLGILGAAVLFPVNGLLASDGSKVIRYCALAVPALLIEQAIGGAALAVGRLRLWNVLQVLGPVLVFFGTAVLVAWLGKGVGGAVAAWVVAQWVTAAIAVYLGRSFWLPASPRYISLAGMGSLLVLGFSAGMSQIVALVNYRIELFVLEAFEGLRAVGIYSVSMALAELLWILSSTLTSVSVAPAVRDDHPRAVAAVATAVRHTLLLTSLCGIVLGATGIFLVPIVFTDAFSGSVTPLLLLIPGVVAYAPCSVLSVYFGVRMGRMRRPLAVAGLSAIVTGLLCLLLVPALGTAGAAVASSIGYLVGGSVLAAMFTRASGASLRDLKPRRSDLAAYRELVRDVRRRLR